MTMYLLYAKSGREFEVTRELQAMGIDAYCARKMRFVRRGKQRRPEAETHPYMGNYLFAEIPAEQYVEALGIKYLASTAIALNAADIRSVAAFRDEVEAEYSAFCAEVAAGYAEDDWRRRNSEIMSEYTEGQALQILGTAFADRVATFKAMVERERDPYPKVQAEVDVFGRMTVIEFDPLDVRSLDT